MTIAILEICTQTHYSAINGLIKTYSTDPNNTIDVYVNEGTAKPLRENGMTDNARLHVFEKDGNADAFLKNIEKQAYDRLHICTIEDFFKEFSRFKPMAKKVIFHVHDIDIWFDSNWSNNIKNFIFNIKNKSDKVRETAKFLRNVLIRNPTRDRILKNIQKFEHQYIVHSDGQKNYLSEFVDNGKIIIFPFAINEGIEKPLMNGVQKEKIRICIPGIVTDTRRDYTGLFKILHDILPDIKGKLTFDFLGYVEKTEPLLLEKLQDLEKRGLDVLYYTDFVYGKKFDAALDKADILLNNQKVTVSHTTKYGVSKESGMLFNMIRGSKPGILPKEYAVNKEFEEAILYYTSDANLAEIFFKLADGTIDIENYKTKAAEIAQRYTPQNLYTRLVPTLTNVLNNPSV
jgi:hypothetical protein